MFKELVIIVRLRGIVLGVVGGEEFFFIVSIIVVFIYVGIRVYILGNMGYCGLKFIY